MLLKQPTFMKKKLSTIFMVCAVSAFSQVGVNTETPQATLDIVASPSKTEIADGVLVPRLKGDELKGKDATYTEKQHGSLVFVTEIPTATTAKTTEIKTVGFYYYDSKKALWIPLNVPEPWYVQNTENMATANAQDIYQNGNVAVGTKFGMGPFHVDGEKNNTSTSASVNEMLDDFMVHSTGRVYIGAKPNELLLLANVEDKIKVAANEDLDVDYDLATTNRTQAIVHRNIISSGTMDNRGPRNRATSITAFEGHTYQKPTLANRFSWYQQRASIVLRTGRDTDDGGEIWFGTAGTSSSASTSPKQSWFRAVMDEKGYWAFGADPNGEAYSSPSERLDVLYGGLRLRQLNTPAYTSTNSGDRIVVVDDKGVLKTRAAEGKMITNISNKTNKNEIQRINRNTKISSATTLVNASSNTITLEIDKNQEFDGNQLIIKKIDHSTNLVNIKSSTNKKIDAKNSYEITQSMGGVVLQYFDNDWYIVSKM